MLLFESFAVNPTILLCLRQMLRAWVVACLCVFHFGIVMTVYMWSVDVTLECVPAECAHGAPSPHMWYSKTTEK